MRYNAEISRLSAGLMGYARHRKVLKMGAYNLTTDDIVEIFEDALEDVEGDYTDQQLLDAVNVIVRKNKERECIKA